MIAALLWATALALSLIAPGTANAHKASDAYLQVRDLNGKTADAQASPATHWQLSVALRDIDAALDTLDANGDRKLTWGEIDDARASLEHWAGEGLTLSCNGRAQPPAWTFDALEKREDGHFARLTMVLPCKADAAIGMKYSLMAQQDPTHRLLVAGSLSGRALVSVVSPEHPDLEVRPAFGGRVGGRSGDQDGGQDAEPEAGSGLQVLGRFFKEGLHHLSTGHDHLAFLLILILPIRVFHKTWPEATAPGALKSRAVWRLVQIISAFTLGHSVTLSLAALGWISAPGWVEPAIAFTILFSALLNLYTVRWIRADLLALGFGLVHGLGFSSAIREAGVDAGLLPWALAGFNLGIEAGQLLALGGWFALHWLLTRMVHYEQIVVRGGSYALLMLALFWTVQRI